MNIICTKKHFNTDSILIDRGHVIKNFTGKDIPAHYKEIGGAVPAPVIPESKRPITKEEAIALTAAKKGLAKNKNTGKFEPKDTVLAQLG